MGKGAETDTLVKNTTPSAQSEPHPKTPARPKKKAPTRLKKKAPTRLPKKGGRQRKPGAVAPTRWLPPSVPAETASVVALEKQKADSYRRILAPIILALGSTPLIGTLLWVVVHDQPLTWGRGIALAALTLLAGVAFRAVDRMTMMSSLIEKIEIAKAQESSKAGDPRYLEATSKMLQALADAVAAVVKKEP